MKFCEKAYGSTLTHSPKIKWIYGGPFLVYLFLSPLYLFPSGLPQIADAILIIGLLTYLVEVVTGGSTKIRPVYFLGLFFAFYTIVVNMINYIFYPEFRFVLSSMIYPYNILMFIFVSSLLERYGSTLREAAFLVLAAATVMELIWAIIFPQTHWREMGSFNNPNQLAYWSLLTATMLVLLKSNNKFGLLGLGVLFLLGFLQTMALSKAGLITYSLFLLVLFFSPKLNNTSRILAVSALFLTVSLSLLLFGGAFPQTKALQNAADRLGNIGQEADDSFEGRGYYRIAEHPQYLFLGAGEGAFHRFSETNKELHSGLATILFSYGIVGALLFSSFLYMVFRKKPLYAILFFIPVLMFGIPGQNFRFTHFWIFLAILYTMNDMPKSRRSLETNVS